MILITALAASVLALLYVKLSLRVVKLRRSLKVSVGDGGHDDLHFAIRAQGNLTEYTPMSLILLAALELNGAPWYLTAVLALAVIAGRWFHQRGLHDAKAPIKLRVLGMKFTLYGIMAMAACNVVLVAYRLVAA